MGGHGVWDLGWRLSTTVGKALVTVLNRNERFLSSERFSLTGPIEDFQLVVFSGAEQKRPRRSKVEGSRRRAATSRAWLEAAGCGPVRYTEMAGVGHSCTRDVFSRDDLLPWLFQQVSRTKKSSWG